MTLECGIRFLTDYLEGDTYFKIHRDGQNLDRCRTQFKLVRDMEARWDEMAAVVKNIPEPFYTKQKRGRIEASALSLFSPSRPGRFVTRSHTPYPPAGPAHGRAPRAWRRRTGPQYRHAGIQKGRMQQTALLTTQMSVTTPQISMLSGAPPHSASASAGSAAQPNVGLSTMDTPSRTPGSHTATMSRTGPSPGCP